MNSNIKRLVLLLTVVLFSISSHAQHGPNLVIKGIMSINNGAIVTVQGDLHIKDSSGYLKNDGIMEVEGNIYKDDGSQFGGKESGKMVLRNDQVNIGEVQFIYGEFTGPNAFRKLDIDNQGIIPMVRLAGDIQINKKLTLSSGSIISENVLTPGSGNFYTVTIMDNAPNAISGNLEDYFIHGKLRWYIGENQSYLFPVGILSSNYSGPMPVVASFGNSPGFMEVEIDISPVPENAFFTNCDVGDASNGTTSPDGIQDQIALDCVVGGWNINVPENDSDNIISFFPPQNLLDACTSPFYYILTDDNMISGCPVTDFNSYGLNTETNYKIIGASDWMNSGLPVELTAFKAAGFSNFINLSWQTATETNSDGFELQKSNDGIDFESLSWIEGQNHSTSLVNYSFNDEQVLKNTIYYYRLKMVNLDGSFEFSEVRTAVLENAIQFSEARVYPNPIDPASQQLTYTALFTGELQIDLFNTFGNLVFSHSDHVTEGFNNISLPRLATGTYYMVIKDDVYTRRATVLISP